MSGRHIPIGKVAGLFGVAGWVKVRSYTRPRQNIVHYPAWRLTPGAEPSHPPAASPPLESARTHGDGVIAKFAGVDDRAAAAALLEREITLERTRFAPLPASEYYWFELIGLEVVNAEGRTLGVVRRLLETGANDVLVVEGDHGSHLIPYVDGDYVQAVDLEEMRMKVNWKREWRT